MIKTSVGDRVTVYRKTNPNGWRNAWVAGMDPLIGGTGTVTRITEFGVYINFENREVPRAFGFHPASLKRA